MVIWAINAVAIKAAAGEMAPSAAEVTVAQARHVASAKATDVASAKATDVASAEAADVASAKATDVTSAKAAAHVASAAVSSAATAAGLRTGGNKAAGKQCTCQDHHYSSSHDILRLNGRDCPPQGLVRRPRVPAGKPPASRWVGGENVDPSFPLNSCSIIRIEHPAQLAPKPSMLPINSWTLSGSMHAVQPRRPGPVGRRKAAAAQLDDRCGCALLANKADGAHPPQGGRGHEARRAPSARQPHGFASGDKRGAAVLVI
jgi:hypothetical protein